jgi:aldehyde:ferredoxin oxidoreductase
MSTEELETCGERIFNLERALHIRNYGRNRVVDETIEWYCELPEKTDGTKVDAETFRRILDVYYVCRGWDGERGIPRRGKLVELGLENVDGALRA